MWPRPLRHQKGKMKIAKDGVSEESLIVNSEHIYGFSSESGHVNAEAIVKIKDVAGRIWAGNLQVRIPVVLQPPPEGSGK